MYKTAAAAAAPAPQIFNLIFCNQPRIWSLRSGHEKKKTKLNYQGIFCFSFHILLLSACYLCTRGALFLRSNKYRAKDAIMFTSCVSFARERARAIIVYYFVYMTQNICGRKKKNDKQQCDIFILYCIYDGDDSCVCVLR